MLVKGNYVSPLGELIILCDDEKVKGVWFSDQKYFGANYNLATVPTQETQLVKQVKKYLEQYFSGEEPSFDPLLLDPDVTPFRKKVLRALLTIPYGQTATYKEIARSLSTNPDGPISHARAVGGAVGHNPLTIFIPCHRVMGSDGSLTGYAGGVERKIKLLDLEGVKQ